MFKELHPLVQSSPLVMLISAEGDNLHVAISQKSSKKGTAISISVSGTPDELDADLPRAIAEAAGANGTKSSVAAQVKAQLGGSDSAAPAAAASSTSKTAAEKAPPKPGSVAARKQECVDDYIKLAAEPKHKEKLNRQYFIDKAKTGRNFERLFGNWQKFQAAAEKAMKAAAAAAPGAQSATTTPAPETTTATSHDVSASHEDDDTTLPLPGVESQSDTGSSGGSTTTSTTEEPPAPQTPSPAPVWRVELADNTLLFEGEQTRELTRGVDIDHGGKTYVVQEIDTDALRVVVRHKFFDVVHPDGTVLGRETRELEAGDEVSFGAMNYTIASVNNDRYTVLAPAWTFQLRDGTEISKGTTPEPKVLETLESQGIKYIVTEVFAETFRAIVTPVKVRKVFNDEGALVGSFEGDLVEGANIKIDQQEFTVMGFTEKAVFVELAAAAQGV